jgi:hypothetical protein
MADETETKKSEGYSVRELEIIHDVENCKAQCETRIHEKKVRLSNTVVLATLIVLICMNVAIVVYAAYEIVHISGVSNLTGIHITPSITKAVDSLLNNQGKNPGN